MAPNSHCWRGDFGHVKCFDWVMLLCIVLFLSLCWQSCCLLPFSVTFFCLLHRLLPVIFSLVASISCLSSLCPYPCPRLLCAVCLVLLYGTQQHKRGQHQGAMAQYRGIDSSTRKYMVWQIHCLLCFAPLSCSCRVKCCVYFPGQPSVYCVPAI